MYANTTLCTPTIMTVQENGYIRIDNTRVRRCTAISSAREQIRKADVS
jgi:hypothetical protein